MRGNLENAVDRRVDNELAGAHMFCSTLLDDLGTRCGFIPQRTAPNLFFKLRDYFARKTVGISRERLIQPNTRHLPMTSGRIFPRRVRYAFAICSDRRGRRGYMREGRNIRKPQPSKVSQLQPP